MNLINFEENVKSTGFILEHEVSSLLIDSRWSVINNKYYVDDVQKAIREIDIIAYKSVSYESVRIYTTLIISCKKSETDAWALISKDIKFDDPNIEWHPTHSWSNDPVLKYTFNEKSHAENYLPKGRLYNKIFKPNNHVFAFQEMKLDSGKVQNDKNIFSSITSLMKSQSYELESLPNRKKQKSVYFFTSYQ
ncbi:hypothetical protein [Yersinia rochesterensis]|uniref:Uncharacterized protein n=1 Tax=Yersinia rochesterensis TaxID=1604335 RepID=A0A8E4BMB1_9GAMM|nr:hypothetical protein [Yersinia rochesterensis]AYD45754.1 hypothetical protein DXZ79_19995 [Yersinia rochesterensis]